VLRANRSGPPAVLWAILTAQIAYGAFFVYRSSLVVDGTRYFMLFDDAMISMTYARTFAEGGGLVWYPGAEPVQGYTNLLWTLIMAAVHLLPLPMRSVSLVVQALGVAMIPLTSWFALRTFRIACPELRHGWLVALLVGAYFPFYLWAGLGMEAGGVTLLLAINAWGVARAIVRRRSDAGVFLVMAAGLLTRLDYAIFAALGALFLLAAVRSDPAQLRRAVLGCGFLAATLGAICLFQYAYYGDPLPNTYALKLGVPLSLRLGRGLASTAAFFASFSPVLVILASAVFAGLVDAPRLLKAYLFSLVAADCLYNVYTGGDAWEWGALANRFQLPVVPVLMLIVAAALAFGVDRTRLGPRARGALLFALGLIIVLRVNAGSLLDPERAASALRSAALREPIFTREVHDLPVLRAGLLVREAAREPLTVAVSSAGISPYVIGDGRFIDLLGRSDRVVARQAPRSDVFLPGHTKWNLAHSIGELDPDLCIGDWDSPARYFREPVVTVPGAVPIFLKRSLLRDGRMSAAALLDAYRRFGDGSERALLEALLQMRGFRPGQATGGFALDRRGELVFPADLELSFRYRALRGARLHIDLEARPVETLALGAGQEGRYRLRGRAGQRLAIRLEPRETAPRAGAAALELWGLQLR
jgi:hypothetical protein